MCNDAYHTDDFLQASYFLKHEDYQKAFYFWRKEPCKEMLIVIII